MEMCKFMYILCLVECLLMCLVRGQLPPRISIPGAIASPSPRSVASHSRRPGALRSKPSVTSNAATLVHITPRTLEEPKPVTEVAEDDLPDAYLPHLLREQQLSNAQQAQFQQTVAAFLNSESSILPDAPPTLTHLIANEEPVVVTTPQYSTRFPERLLPLSSPTPKSVFSDFGIGANLINGGGSHYSSERNQPLPTAILNSAPVRERINVIRTRPASREPKIQYEVQPVPSPVLPARNKPTKPKQSIQPRLLVEQNHLNIDRYEGAAKERRRPAVAQTIRKWREENEDGSITWGYENDDGSFKEEIIGIDCVTKGTYGYVDPDGNKREYHYETGIKCDPNNREEEAKPAQDGFINYEENRAILPNGIEIDMSQLGKKKSRRPSNVSIYKA